MSPDPLRLIRRSHEVLEELGIRHGLIGGWAVIAWGRIRVTRDLDWLAEVPTARRKPLLTALERLGKPLWRPPGIDDPLPAGLIRVSPKDSGDPVIDIILAARAADVSALGRCESVPMGTGSVPAVRPEDLVAMKLEAGGGLDVEDARELLKTQARTIDSKILEQACRARRVNKLLSKLRAEPL